MRKRFSQSGYQQYPLSIFRYTCSIALFLLFFLSKSPQVQAETMTLTPSANAGWSVVTTRINKSESDPREYQLIQLDNDMRVLLISDPQATKSLAAIAIPVGSLDNPPSQPGLAHYLEHMLLMGSQRYPSPEGFSEYLKKHGGSHNASTALYRTAYYLEVENSGLDQAVDRLADALAAPLLDPVHADRERNAVNAELTLARSRDGLRLAQVSAETINPLHPAARFSGGNLETLRDKPGSNLQEELKAFYHRYYSANLMVGVIYSTQSLPRLASLASSTFGRIADHKAIVPAITQPIVTQKQEGVMIHYVPAQPHKQLMIEFRVKNTQDKFRSKTDTYIGYLIGNRSAGTLADWLQEQGLADGISAGADLMAARDSGIFSINVSLTDKGMQEQDKVIAAVFDYLKLLRNSGINRAYFNEISHVLALDFRYQSITRNMSYVERLADSMLRVPAEHVLDYPYVADSYDPDAIAAQLDFMTPEHARIWLIGPDEPHNKKAYFVNAPYQVEPITVERLARWHSLAEKFKFSLPEYNSYIPDDFTLQARPASSAKIETIPQRIFQMPGVRVFYMPSTYFSNEPKASVTLVLRNPQVTDTARKQVLYALTDYLAGLSLDQLSYQAGVGGIDFSSDLNAGLSFSASGFSQRLPTLLRALITEYATFSPTESQLIQAKSWYKERLDAADKVKPYEQAIEPIQMLSRLPYVSRATRRNLVDSITLPELMSYRSHLLKNGSLDVLVVGNLSKVQSIQLVQQIKNDLSSSANDWQYGERVHIDKTLYANLKSHDSGMDSALAAVYVPRGFSQTESMAYSALLAQIIQPWFYGQLRTQEQLGYAIFSMPIAVGAQWGIGFLVQSNSHTPDYLYQRYVHFYAQTYKRLQEMSNVDFDQYKQALISQLEQPPQTLDEESARFRQDFNRGNALFNRRDLLINTLKAVTPEIIRRYYEHAIMAPDGLAILSQLNGSEHDQNAFAEPDGWTEFRDVKQLQRQLSRQPIVAGEKP